MIIKYRTIRTDVIEVDIDRHRDDLILSKEKGEYPEWVYTYLNSVYDALEGDELDKFLLLSAEGHRYIDECEFRVGELFPVDVGILLTRIHGNAQVIREDL